MMYNLANELERESFLCKAKNLACKQTMVELVEKRPRSLAQNAYLHTALAFFALQVGLTLQEVKDDYFKRHCNPTLFVRTRFDHILNTSRSYLRSTTELSKEEMGVAIDRFLSFAAENGVYIAPADEYVAVLHMQHDIERSKRFL